MSTRDKQVKQHQKIWKVYKTVKEMLVDRGYTEFVSGKIVNTFDEFIDTHVKYSVNEEVDAIPNIFDKKVLNFTCLNLSTGKLIIVYFTNDDSIGRKHITMIYEKMVAAKLVHCILIYPKTLTASAKKDLDKAKVHIESFAEDDLVVNITRHYLMPKYKILTKEEKEELYGGKYQIKDSQLPRILVSDKSARYFGLRRGDVVQIIRKSETAGLSVTYRLCN